MSRAAGVRRLPPASGAVADMAAVVMIPGQSSENRGCSIRAAWSMKDQLGGDDRSVSKVCSIVWEERGVHKAAGTPLFAAAFVLQDGSVSVVVRLLDLSRYSAAIGNLQAMLLGPIPDRLGLLAIRGRASAATATPRTADLATRLDKGLQRRRAASWNVLR